MKRILGNKISLVAGLGISSLACSKYVYDFTHKDGGLVLAAENAMNMMNENGQEKKDDETLTLKSVQVFFRHGARTPLAHLPKIEEVNYDKTFIHARVPYTDVPYEVYNLENGGPRPPAHLDERYKKTSFKGGVYAGALTALGKDQTYNLGKQLKRKYFSLLGLSDTFNANEVSIRATNVNRTIESLRGVLGGLFGKDAFPEPARIPVLPLHREFMFPQTRYCKPFSKLYLKVTEVEDDLEVVKSLTEKINRKIGHEGNLNIMAWRDNMVARKAHGLTVPTVMLQYENEIEAAATALISAHTAGFESDGREALKYSTGPMLDTVVENLKNTAQNNHSHPKLYLYSGHDTTVVPLAVALSIFDNKWPDYCAHISVELWEKTSGENIVKILYCGQETVPKGLKSPEMSIADFEKLVKPYRMPLKEWCSTCQLRGPESNEEYRRHPVKIDETIAPKAM